MANVRLGTHPFPALIRITHVPFLLALILFSLLAGGSTPGSHGTVDVRKGYWPAPSTTNSCSVAWGSVVFRMSVSNFWSLGSAVVSDVNFADLDMDEEEFELYRVERIHHAFEMAECLANDWPEIDLPWCLADWHDGKLIPESMVTLGETCWWCAWYGWSMDPALTRQQDIFHELNIPYVLQPISWVSRVVYMFFVSPWMEALLMWFRERMHGRNDVVLYGCIIQ